MRNRVQLATTPRRNLAGFLEQDRSGGAQVPSEEYVTRKDLEAFENRIAEKVQSAVQQVGRQRPAAAARTPEEQSMLHRMREMAD